MWKNKKYYEFSYFEEEKEKNTTMLKIIIVAIITIIVVFLAFISYDVKENLEISSQTKSEIQQKIEKEKAELEEKAKLAEEERLKKEELERQEEERKRREEMLPKLTEEGRNNMQNIYHSETKRAFLTFDDGPSTLTPQILDTLKNENIKATFFMLGCNVVNYPETVKRVYEEGHYIANHGYTHVYSSIYVSPQAVLDEYNRCNDAIKNALGEQEYNSHLFRFPGGSTGGKYATLKNDAKNLLSQNDILYVDWNALTGDAETQHPVAEKLLEQLKNTTQGKSSVVILMHDTQAKQVTADILPQVIAYLREQGYEFKNFYEIIK